MSAKEECEFYKAVYDDEIARLSRLTGRATLYFTIISFFLGVIVFKFDDLEKFLSLFHVPVLWYVLIALILSIALVFNMLAICIRKFEAIADLESVFKEMAEGEAFWEARIADYTVANSRNTVQGSRIALMLKVSSICLVIAASLQTAVLLIALFGKTFSVYKNAHKIPAGVVKMKRPVPPKSAPPPTPKSKPAAAQSRDTAKAERMRELLEKRQAQENSREEADNPEV